MAKKKLSLNWYFLIVGAILLYIGLSSNKNSERVTHLRTITVELSKDIINVKGRHNRRIDYKFWTKEYANQFNILDGTITRGKSKPISNLKGGDKVELLISEVAFNELGTSTEDIIVKGLSLNGTALLSEVEFKKNNTAYGIRLSIFSVFLALMFLINGLTQVPKKINYVLVGVFGGVILIMRIFEFGIY